MILEVYAGKRKVISLVQHYILVDEKAGSYIFRAQREFVAIPGGSIKSEKDVRKWADQEGFKIHKVYEAGIDDETALLVS